MNKRHHYLGIFFALWSFTFLGQSDKAPLSAGQLISFQYNNESLANVVNYVASKKEVNLLFPTKADEKLEAKLTWHLDKKVSIDEAWNLLQTILTIAGYSLVAKPTYYEIVKNTDNITREPFPLYVGVNPDELPISDENIRYIYYLVNHKHEGEGETDTEIAAVLKSMLPADARYKIDTASNALLVMGKANDIRSVMAVISHLDRPGFQERMEIIKLNYTQAHIVADLFNNKVLQGGDSNRYHVDAKKPSEAAYFSKHVKIIANDRTNSLIVLGKTQALERIRHFINQYIDVEPDSGKSILHVYKLQYLDAPSFAEVLRKIVQSKNEGGVDQSIAKAAGTVTGPQRYFDDVIISVDTPLEGDNAPAIPAQAGGESEQAIKATKYYGGNNLIIAARSDDWKKIRELIEKLDQPSPQVLIEVLIADLTLDDTRALGSFFRNPAKIPMPGQINFQSAQLQPGVMPNEFTDPQTIGAIAPAGPATDLLRQFDNTTNPRSDGPPANDNIAQLLQAGSTVISMSDNDGKTWGITQILKLIDHTKILSHPHVISTNNQVATIKSTETRVLVDQASGSQGGTIVATNKNIPASLSVSIIPRISISQTRESTVNLQVVIDISEYTSAATSTTNGTRNTRNVATNATVNTGDILALGGLIRAAESDSVGQTPILSQIPLIGWLFKNRNKTKKQTNLTVFISPTIIQPRLRSGIGVYTQDYLAITKNYAGSDSNLFGTLKDPITRWFFNDKSPTDQFTKDFMSRDEVHINSNTTPMPEVSKKSGISEINKAALPADQLTDLKELLKNVDNPFAKVDGQQVAHVEPTPKPKSRRRRS